MKNGTGRISLFVAVFASSFLMTTAIAFAVQQETGWLWNGSSATLYNFTTRVSGDVLAGADNIDHTHFSVPISVSTNMEKLLSEACSEDEKTWIAIEFAPPLHTVTFHAATQTDKIWRKQNGGCEDLACDSDWPIYEPNGNCNTTNMRPNMAWFMYNTTELSYFPWWQFVTTHEPGHALGLGHEVGDMWVYLFPSLNCSATIMFSQDCRERWIANHGTLFEDLQTADVSWINGKY